MLKPTSKQPALACCISGGGGGAAYYDNILLSADDIADAAIGLQDQGVEQIIINARDLETQKPTLDPDAYRNIMDTVRAKGFSGEIGFGLPRLANEIKGDGTIEPGIIADEQLSQLVPLLALKPDFMCIDTPTQNVFYRTWSMTLPQLVRIALLLREHGVRPRFTASDISHFNDLGFLAIYDYLVEPYEIDIRTLVPDDLTFLVTKVPEGVPWFAYVRPDNQELLQQAVALGGGIRFGIGDSPLMQTGNKLNLDNVEAAKMIMANVNSD